MTRSGCFGTNKQRHRNTSCSCKSLLYPGCCTLARLDPATDCVRNRNNVPCRRSSPKPTETRPVQQKQCPKVNKTLCCLITLFRAQVYQLREFNLERSFTQRRRKHIEAPPNIYKLCGTMHGLEVHAPGNTHKYKYILASPH